VTLHLLGIGHFHPDTEITNRFLEDLGIGTDDEWIVDRVGIHSRRTVLPLDYIRETRNADPRGAVEAALVSNAVLGSRAAEVAITRAGISRDDVGMVISGSSASACDNFDNGGMPVEGCKHALENYKKAAKAMKKSCDD